MTHHKCKHCGNTYHWSHAFAKFGYDDGDGDGDGNIQTTSVAQILENAGYTVHFSRWSPHNTLIYSIKKNGIEFMPLNSLQYCIGYDDPKNYLPEKIQEILDRKIPPSIIFI